MQSILKDSQWKIIFTIFFLLKCNEFIYIILIATKIIKIYPILQPEIGKLFKKYSNEKRIPRFSVQQRLSISFPLLHDVK